jgi:hypothetical protein
MIDLNLLKKKISQEIPDILEDVELEQVIRERSGEKEIEVNWDDL